MVHCRWHAHFRRRLRLEGVEHRAGEAMASVEVRPGLVVKIAAWMLDPAAWRRDGDWRPSGLPGGAFLAACLQNIGRNAVSYSLRRLVDRVMRQVGVARRRLDVAVTEQLADDRQGLAERERTGRKAVSDVMDADVVEPGPCEDGQANS